MCFPMPSPYLSMPSHPSHITPPDRPTDVLALNRVPGRAEAETDVLVPSPAALSWLPRLGGSALVVGEDVGLLLESALALDGQLGGHDCGRIGAIGGGEGEVVSVAVGGSASEAKRACV